MLDFRVETFLEVCRCGSYTEAAKHLNITQPGVSQHIRYLEEYYQSTLFVYENRRLSLTPAGRRLKESVTSMRNDGRHLLQELQELQGGHRVISFGATLTVGEFFLPPKMALYLQKNPEVQMNLTIDNTGELLRLLEDGAIEFAIVEGYFQKESYEHLLVSKEVYCLVGNQGNHQEEELSELFKNRLLVREDGSGSKEILERFLFEQGYSFDAFAGVSAVNSIHVLKELVKNGCGITFLYEIAVKNELAEGSLAVIPLKGFPLIHEFHFIWRKNSVFSDVYHKVYHDLLGME